MRLIYFLTESRYVAPTDPDWYVKQILHEDQLLSDALADLGIKSERVDWADPTVDWSRADAAIFRTTWDYFERLDEFSDWLIRTNEKTRLINPLEQVLWNLDKHYLIDLESKGVPIVPSKFIPQGESRSLLELTKGIDWEEFILKPCISATAFQTFRISREEISSFEHRFREIIKERSFILQEFQTSIQAKGEVSHIVMGGQYSHSVLKKAKGTEFRVQDDFGGTVHDHQASKEERELAEKVFGLCKTLPAYGRLDVMWDSDQKLIVSELEVIEPELWFRNYPASAKALADHLARIL